MIAQIVYALCAVTSIGCAVLLLKSFRANRSALLLWSGLCFALISVSNILLFIDLVVVPGMDLSLFRTIIAALGHLMLLFGMISKNS